MGNKSGKADAGGDRKSGGRRGGGNGDVDLDDRKKDRKGDGGDGKDRKDDYDSDSDEEKGDGKRQDRKDDKAPQSPAARASGMTAGVLTEQEQARAKEEADRDQLPRQHIEDPDGEDKWNVNQILTQQRERKKREDETKRELQRRFEKIQYPFYGEDVSPERNVGLWGLCKALWYLILMGVGLSIRSKNFGAAVCTPYDMDTSECLHQDSTVGGYTCYSVSACVTTSGTPACTGQAGCYTDYATPSVFNCLDFASWDAKPCITTATCATSVMAAGREPILYLAIIFFFSGFIELLAGTSFIAYAPTHTSEFGEPNRYRSFAMFMCKWQTVMAHKAIFAAYMIANYYTGGSREKCADALNPSTGDVIQYNNQMQLYCILAIISIVGFTIIGTWVRFKYALRGELFVPMSLDSLNVPANLDCATCRSLDRPRLCHDPVRNCMQPPPDDEESCYHSIPCSTVIGCCCGCLCDGIFACTCFPIGFCLENSCKNRSWIAP